MEPEKDPEEGRDPSQQDPDNGGDPPEPGTDPGGEEGDISELPEWAQKRIKGSEGAIRDLKDTFGAKSVKELKEKLKGKPDPNKPAPKPKAEGQGEDGKYVTKEELALYHQGYQPDELEIARSLRPGVPLSEALKDDTVSAAIEGVRGKRNAERQTPEPTSRIPVAGKKSFQDLKPGEQKQEYGGAVDKLIRKGRQSGRNVGA